MIESADAAGTTSRVPAVPAALPEPVPAQTDDTLLVPGETCWRIERADRHAVFVDAADYFATLKRAVLRAERRVLFIGWDFDPRIRLDPRTPGRARDDRLGRVLEKAVRDNPRLEIGVLQWDLGMVVALNRRMAPIVWLNRRTPDRLRFAVDTHHPLGGAHHQKIVVIDDCLAFAGGIDVTADRWDTSEHRDRHPMRHRPHTTRLRGPWHDVTSLVSGPAARAIGDLARERWESGTGERLEPVDDVEACWPDGVETFLTDVDVAISRTRPAYGGAELVHEIELLWLAAIAAARRTVYVETQYFANRRIAEAIADRLAEDDGPEFVVLNPRGAEGWLESKAMDTARVKLLDLVRRADRHDRFRLLVPVTEGRRPVYVHAKVTCVDDRLLRIGSSNLNNRSMGLDTECDLSIEARTGDPRETELREAVLAMRHRLLGEHLGVAPEEVAAAVEQHGGSLVRAVDALVRPAGRSLVPFEPPQLDPVERFLADTELLDAEHTPNRWRRVKQAFAGRRRRQRG
ncbi:phosphatidylserine/phosphatidylglycerophosphate/cardiolipin synthase-like enzyme [Geodermatophilus normandii]|uniref:Phosphatidylserine/phosphatidylglycerophosphate/ cardiolipin synthase-like enzyme n=1 Tax=Geodermatophilus normandii TaxID=1137989 RepID=A0A317QDP6_9ACTN|nr:phospholipase D-like domain-containing protein [Geodermatophilus normandii]PWW21021.1 phosphatidylserine/phosphatidylglycerophosphate/cardiolipin synthase-like enzyme [Geodermatophilus normandii]